MQDQAPNWRVHGALLTVALVYAATYTIAKSVVPSWITPSAGIVMRISGALVLLLVYTSLFVKREKIAKKHWPRLLACATFGVAINMVMYFEGLSRTSPIHASLIMVTTPMLVLVIGFFMGTERFTRLKVTGIIVGTLGAASLVYFAGKGDKEATPLGDLLILINALSFAVYLVIVRPLMAAYNPITITKLTFAIGGLMVLPFGLNELLQVRWAEMGPPQWGAVLFLIIGTTFITFVFNAYALRHVPSSTVGSYIYLQPFLGTLIAVGTAGYTLHGYQVACGALVLLGVFLSSKPGKLLPPETP